MSDLTAHQNVRNRMLNEVSRWVREGERPCLDYLLRCNQPLSADDVIRKCADAYWRIDALVDRLRQLEDAACAPTVD